MKPSGNPFRKISGFLVDWLKLDQPGKGNRGLHQELIALEGGRRSAVRAYYVRKMELVLMTVTVGGLTAAAGFLISSGQDRSIENQTLIRPGYGEGDRNEELTVRVEGEQEHTLDITVQERKYTDKEQQKLLEQAVTELEEIIQGGNTSMDEVRQKLVMPSALQDGAVDADWMTDPYGVIDYDGSIIGAEDEDGTLVEIQGTLTCGSRESVYTAYARVYPPVLSEQEKMEKDIREQALNADERDRYKDTVALPGEIDGKQIVWERPEENLMQTILFLALTAAVCIYLGKDQTIHQKAEERREQLHMDYPDLMWKMAMLIEAGLTIKGTFVRIASQYQKEGTGKKRYAYEEVRGTCFEMQSGIPEAEAYERFGRRCELPEYIRLGSYLSQNLKKGSRGLTQFLEQEAASSLEERKKHARKLGEQAGTKMLFPMILMLAVVLVILMVPAFLSM